MAAIEWFRLWHDMPNDPKWRTVARVSGQPISLVLAVALHLMADASRNVTRGHVTVTSEDLASALDVTDDAIEAILGAMQGRVLDGDRLSGWEKRQPKREDMGNPETGAKSAAERKREQRKREKQVRETAENDDGHAASRDVTLDKDTDKENISIFLDRNMDIGGVSKSGENSGNDAPPAASPAAPPKTNQGTRLPKDWKLPKGWGDWALQSRSDMTEDAVRHQAACFADYWHGKAGADARKADWEATWRNWIRRANGPVTGGMGRSPPRQHPAVHPQKPKEPRDVVTRI